MALKYNAFISYRHSEQDSKIAGEIQTRLERFRIPKAIVKKTGVKRFERIFRDKEELPITSDLNEDIDRALENSDHLIVICSTRTCESIWVLKEIETFLKYHDKKHIYTVLVDGEPEQVIPDILMHDTVTNILPDGRIETTEELIEPLSCDYRMDIKKARRVELPRLAAAMIGCSYDELIQRRRQYIRRRNSMIGCTAAAMLAAIIGYLSWSLMQIQMNYDLAQSNYALAQSNLELAEANYAQAQDNYMQALRNQSAYLASESAELLAAGDRLGAVQLALAALPSEGNDRPITSEAEFALSNALGIYLTPGLSDSDAIWNYGSGYEIEKFRIDHENLRVFSLDSLRNLNIWSLKDHTLLKTFKSDQSRLNNFVIDHDGRVALAYSDELVMMDSDLETVLWTMPLGGDYLYSSIYYETFGLSYDGSEILYYANGTFIVFDDQTGDKKCEYDINDYLEDGGEYSWGMDISKVAFSPDNSKIAIVYTHDLDEKGIVIFDRETLEWKLIGDSYTFIPELAFTPDSKNIIFTYEDNITDNSYSFSGIQVLNETNRFIDCYNVETGKQLWCNSVSHTLVGYDSGMVFVKYGYEDSASDAIAVSFSNKCVVIDINTGEKLTERELLSEYIDAYLNESETRLYFVLRNGQYMTLRLDDPDMPTTGFQYFADGIDDSDAYNGDDGVVHYLVVGSHSNYLTEYSSFFYDRSYKAVPDTGTGGIRRYAISGKRLIALDGDMNLYGVDMTTGKVAWTVEVEGDNYTAVEFIGNDEFGNVYMINSNLIDDDYSDKLYKIDVSNGDITRVDDLPDAYALHTCFAGGCIYISYSGGYTDNPYILKYDTSDGSSEKIELDPEDSGYLSMCDLYVAENGKHALMIDTITGNNAAYLVNLETGSMITLDITGECFAAWSPDSEWVAISNGEIVSIYQADGPRSVVLSEFETVVSDVHVCEKGLIVMMDNGLACLYDKDGNLISSIDAFPGGVSALNLGYEDTSFSIKDNYLIIKMGEYSSVVYLDEFKIKVVIAGLLAYDNESEKYYCRIYGDVGGAGSLGYFNVRSIDELIEEGQRFVGDAQMSTDMKKRYGIDN